MNQPAKTNPPAKQDPASNAIATVDKLFRQHQKAIEDALPKHVTAKRMMRVALTELRRSYALQKCDALSFLGSIVQASQLGLEPGGSLGHCYLIPYGAECTLQLGYRGMVDLARRSGNISSLSARIVYEGDDFHVKLGTDEGIEHTPRFKTTKAEFVYAVAQLRDGGTQFDIMSIAEVEHIRDTYSSAYKRDPKKTPWYTAPDEMAKKTVVRRLFKMLPTSIEIRDAVDVDDNDDQHNAKLIDPNHEVMDILPDPDRAASIAAAGANDHYQPAPVAAAEKNQAIDEFARLAGAVKSVGGDPEQITGNKTNWVLTQDPGTILANADLLQDWLKKKK